MLTLLLFAATQTAWAQVCNATGAVNFETGSSWVGGIAPSAALVTSLTIQTAAQVTVNNGLLAASASLTLGVSGTASTALIMNNVAFLVQTLNWTNGYIELTGANAKFTVGAAGSATMGAAASADREIVGGVFELGQGAMASSSATISGGVVICSGCTLTNHGNTWNVQTGATLQFGGGTNASSPCTVSDIVVFNGSGSVTVVSGSSLTFSPASSSDSISLNVGQTTVAGNLSLGGGNVVVQSGNKLTFSPGSYLKRTSASASGTLTVAANATVNFAAGATSWIEGQIVCNGRMSVDSGASATVNSATSTQTQISGNGNISVSGTFAVATNLSAVVGNAGPTLNINSGGTLSINAGVSAAFSAVTMTGSSTWNLAMATTNNVGTFATVTISGSLTLAGNLVLSVPVNPSVTVTLITAASISGSAQFMVTGGATVGRRLLAQGTIVQNGNSIQYQPGGNTTGTSDASHPASIFALLAAGLAALI